MNCQLPGSPRPGGSALVLAAGAATPPTTAQDRLKRMPGYERYQKVSSQLNGAVRSGAVNGTWSADSRLRIRARRQAIPLRRRRRRVRPRLAPRRGSAPAGRGTRRERGGAAAAPGIERGRQAASAEAPDGKLKAFYRDRNLWVSDVSGGNESAITTDGSEKDRIKYGTASWVYGEELGQTSAIWWSPDSTKVAYYRFDEKQVLDYNLQLDQTKIQSAQRRRGVSEGRHEQSGRRSVRLRRRVEEEHDGSTCATASRSTTASSGTTSIACRGRRTAASCCSTARTGARTSSSSSRRIPRRARRASIVREEWPTGWVDNRPPMQFLKDNSRFIWESERNGFANLYLYDSQRQAAHAAHRRTRRSR